MKNSRLTLIALLLVWGAGLFVTADGAKPARTPAESDAAKKLKHAKAAEEFFAGEIPRLKIEISPEERERLQKDERHYVEATLTETTLAGPRLYEKVSAT